MKRLFLVTGVALGAFASYVDGGTRDKPYEVAGFRQTGEIRECVRIGKISETRVLDDQHILFRLGVTDYYINRLPKRCFDLKLQGKFSYEVSGGSQLCDIDAIRVLDGHGTGAGCLLGPFEKLEKVESN